MNSFNKDKCPIYVFSDHAKYRLADRFGISESKALELLKSSVEVGGQYDGDYALVNKENDIVFIIAVRKVVRTVMPIKMFYANLSLRGHNFNVEPKPVYSEEERQKTENQEKPSKSKYYQLLIREAVEQVVNQYVGEWAYHHHRRPNMVERKKIEEELQKFPEFRKKGDSTDTYLLTYFWTTFFSRLKIELAQQNHRQLRRHK